MMLIATKDEITRFMSDFDKLMEQRIERTNAAPMHDVYNNISMIYHGISLFATIIQNQTIDDWATEQRRNFHKKVVECILQK